MNKVFDIKDTIEVIIPFRKFKTNIDYSDLENGADSKSWFCPDCIKNGHAIPTDSTKKKYEALNQDFITSGCYCGNILKGHYFGSKVEIGFGNCGCHHKSHINK